MKWRRTKRASDTVSILSVSSDMSTIVIDDYELPVPLPDLERVAAILRENDVFCAGPTAGDIYNWLTCRKAHADGVTVLALLDRNVLNDVVTLARTAIGDS